MFQLILTNSLIVVFSTQGAMFHETLFGTGAQSTAFESEALSTHPHKMTHFVLPGILATHIVDHGIQVELGRVGPTTK